MGLSLPLAAVEWSSVPGAHLGSTRGKSQKDDLFTEIFEQLLAINGGRNSGETTAAIAAGIWLDGGSASEDNSGNTGISSVHELLLKNLLALFSCAEDERESTDTLQGVIVDGQAGADQEDAGRDGGEKMAAALNIPAYGLGSAGAAEDFALDNTGEAGPSGTLLQPAPAPASRKALPESAADPFGRRGQPVNPVQAAELTADLPRRETGASEQLSTFNRDALFKTLFGQVDPLLQAGGGDDVRARVLFSRLLFGHGAAPDSFGGSGRPDGFEAAASLRNVLGPGNQKDPGAAGARPPGAAVKNQHLLMNLLMNHPAPQNAPVAAAGKTGVQEAAPGKVFPEPVFAGGGAAMEAARQSVFFLEGHNAIGSQATGANSSLFSPPDAAGLSAARTQQDSLRVFAGDGELFVIRPGLGESRALYLPKGVWEGVNPLLLPVLVLRVLRQAAGHHAQGQIHLRFKLEPEHLGEVTVRLIYQQGEVHAHFLASNIHAKDAIESSLAQLREALAGQNLHLQNVSVSLGQEGGRLPYGDQQQAEAHSIRRESGPGGFAGDGGLQSEERADPRPGALNMFI